MVRSRPSRARGARWVRWVLAVLLVAVAWILLAPGCRGVRYGIASVFRPGTDYDALEREREAVARAEVAPAAAAPAPVWTEYRGPRGDGIVRESGLALDWPEEGPPELWRVTVGPAYSSVVVAGGLAITMEQRREEEAVVAFERETGALVWEHAWPGRFFEAMSKEGPRGTPAIAGDAVVALGATGELRCLDLATGDLRWRHDLLALGGDENLGYGLSASPRALGERVLVEGARSVFALELATGELAWRALEETLAYATPVLAELAGGPTLLVSTAERVVGLDPANGSERWSTPWAVTSGLTCTQPVPVAADRVLLSAGYGKGSRLLGLALAGDAVEATPLWTSSRLKTRFDEPVLVGAFAYGLDEGVLECLEVATGDRRWKDGRYGYGQLLAAGDRLLVVGEEGEVHLVAADPEEHRELATFRAIQSGVTLNVPALAHGLLYVRSSAELVCFDLRAER